MPTSVQSSTTMLDGEVCSPASIYHYLFPARGELAPLRVTWYDGGLKPRCPDDVDPRDPRQRLGSPGEGVLFIGDKGYITSDGRGSVPRLLPLKRHEEYKRPAATLPRSKGHHADWIAACKGGKAAGANFDYAALLAEVVLLGNVSLRTRQRIDWDAANMKAIGVPQADVFINGQYRKGWEVA